MWCTGQHKGQWRGALIFSLICAWTNGWINNRDAGDFRRHRCHYDVTVMWIDQQLKLTHNIPLIEGASMAVILARETLNDTLCGGKPARFQTGPLIGSNQIKFISLLVHIQQYSTNNFTQYIDKGNQRCSAYLGGMPQVPSNSPKISWKRRSRFNITKIPFYHFSKFQCRDNPIVLWFYFHYGIYFTDNTISYIEAWVWWPLPTMK